MLSYSSFLICSDRYSSRMDADAGSLQDGPRGRSAHVQKRCSINLHVCRHCVGLAVPFPPTHYLCTPFTSVSLEKGGRHFSPALTSMVTGIERLTSHPDAKKVAGMCSPWVLLLLTENTWNCTEADAEQWLSTALSLPDPGTTDISLASAPIACPRSKEHKLICVTAMARSSNRPITDLVSDHFPLTPSAELILRVPTQVPSNRLLCYVSKDFLSRVSVVFRDML